MSAGSGELSREEELVEAPQPENAASKEFEDVQRYGRVTNTESTQMINVRNHFFFNTVDAVHYTGRFQRRRPDCCNCRVKCCR